MILLWTENKEQKNDATVGVRGGWERGGGLVLTLVGRYGRWGKIVFGDQGKHKAPANSPRSPLCPYCNSLNLPLHQAS
jgi:hypothetical protein